MKGDETVMTSKQFNGFIRFLLDNLRSARDEKDPDKKEKKYQKIIDDLEKVIGD